MVLEMIGGGAFLPFPGQWSDPKSPRTIGLRSHDNVSMHSSLFVIAYQKVFL